VFPFWDSRMKQHLAEQQPVSAVASRPSWRHRHVGAARWPFGLVSDFRFQCVFVREANLNRALDSGKNEGSWQPMEWEPCFVQLHWREQEQSFGTRHECRPAALACQAEIAFLSCGKIAAAVTGDESQVVSLLCPALLVWMPRQWPASVHEFGLVGYLSWWLRPPVSCRRPR
jgi:hypothetical protein